MTDKGTRNGVEMKLCGPSVTMEQTREEGERLARLLGTIAEHLGAPKGARDAWTVTGVYFQCDGCGLRRPDRPAPGEGWAYSDGDDFCPACSSVHPAGRKKPREMPRRYPDDPDSGRRP